MHELNGAAWVLRSGLLPRKWGQAPSIGDRHLHPDLATAAHGARTGAMPDAVDANTHHRAAFAPGHREHDNGRLDAVAGSEFVDDRLRQHE